MGVSKWRRLDFGHCRRWLLLAATAGLGQSAPLEDKLTANSQFAVHVVWINSLASKPFLPAKAAAFHHRLLVQQGRISLRLKGRSRATIDTYEASV